MPLAIQGSNTTPSSPFTHASPSPSHSWPLLTTHKWSHKKFGCRKRATVKLIEPLTLHQGLRTAAAGSCSSKTLEPVTKLSPGKEEKKKKRRESDAKWRSNLSVCFKHLETKALRGRNCLKSHLSKEMIVQKTVQKVQYLEAVFMLLNQADRRGRKREFSPTRGHQNLQAARKEFAYKFHYKNRHKKAKVTSPIPKGEGTRVVKDTAVENPEPFPDGVVPEHGKAPSSEQLVPPSVTTRADGAKDENCSERNRVPSTAQQDRAVPSTPTKSLICYEHDLSDDKSSPRNPKFTTRNVILNRYSGRFPQSQVMTSSRPQLPYSPPRTPARSPARNPAPLTPSFYSPAKFWTQNSPAKSNFRAAPYRPPHYSPASNSAGGSATRHGISADLFWPSNLGPAIGNSAKSPSRSLATKHEKAASNQPLYLSPARSPAKSLATGHGRPPNQSPARTLASSPAKKNGSAANLYPPNWSPARTPATGLDTGHRKAASYRPLYWSPTTTPASSPAKSNGSSVPSQPLSWSPVTSPARIPATSIRSAASFQPLYWSPASTPAISLARGQGEAAPCSPSVLSDLVMSSPSKQYKIVGGSITSLGDAEPGMWESSSQADLDSSLDVTGRATPDLMCQEEEIPPWKDDERSRKLTPCSTPHSARFPNSSQPPSVPHKKCPLYWSAKFVNDVRQSREGLLPVPSQTKSTRCKRLFSDDGEKDGCWGEAKLKKEKANTDKSDANKSKVRRKYHKRATAARIRPWDPVASRVRSPVYGISRQRTYHKESKAQTSSSTPIAKHSLSQQTAKHSLSQQTANSKSTTQDNTVARMLQRQRKSSQRGTWIVVEEDEKENLATEDILNVEDWPKEYISKTSNNGQICPDKISPVDQDSSQDSLLLNEIPKLPDDIITPLLMCGESDQCFLEDLQLEKTLQQPRYHPTADTENHFKTTKSDDEIVLTILELEEESRTSFSTRSSPDAIDNLYADPTSVTKTPENDIVDVMEIVTPDQEGFPDHLQGALLEAYKLMSAESGSSGCPPSVILSPVRVSNLSDHDRNSNPDNTSFYLVSPVKQGREEVYLKIDCVDDEDKISESMARFASSALSSQTFHACYCQPTQNNEAKYSNKEQVYSGSTQALLNGQVVGKTSADLKVISYRPKSTLICVDSGTPSKSQAQLPYSVPSTATTVIEFSSKNTDNPSTYPTSDTDAGASYTSTPPYFSSPSSTATPSTPSGYLSLGHLSQSTADATLSSELSEEAYRLSQSPLIKQEPWDWMDPPATDLEADESLDDLMGNNLLARYYHTYDCLGEDAAGGNSGGKGVIEAHVPEWNAKTNDTSQPSQDDSASGSSLATCSTCTSQDSTTADSLLSGELQVVPSLSPDDNAMAGSAVGADEKTGDQFVFQGQRVKYELGGSPDRSLQIFQRWLINQ